eukprot:COSAG06_NODE_1618_length_8914_cov_10.299830_9_plen_66_part_00
MIILPRQARDKHRENSKTDKKERRVSAGGRSVDTAFEYSNEPWVGDAVRAAIAGKETPLCCAVFI